MICWEANYEDPNREKKAIFALFYLFFYFILSFPEIRLKIYVWRYVFL